MPHRTPPGDAPALVACASAATVVSTAGNAVIWCVGGVVGRLTIGLGDVILFSVLGVAAGLALRAVTIRFATRPARSFLWTCAGFVALYALGPLAAAIAPYREGAETFTVTTVLATEVMHLVSGLSIALALVPGGPDRRVVGLARRLRGVGLATLAALLTAVAVVHLESAARGVVIADVDVGGRRSRSSVRTTEPRGRSFSSPMGFRGRSS
jgi:hypothetical protein